MRAAGREKDANLVYSLAAVSGGKKSLQYFLLFFYIYYQDNITLSIFLQINYFKMKI